MSFFRYSPLILASGYAEVGVVDSAVNVVTGGLHLPQTPEDWGKMLGTFALIIIYKVLDYLVNRVAFRKIAAQQAVAAPCPPDENQGASQGGEPTPTL
jgi:hypothetical protein